MSLNWQRPMANSWESKVRSWDSKGSMSHYRARKLSSRDKLRKRPRRKRPKTRESLSSSKSLQMSESLLAKHKPKQRTPSKNSIEQTRPSLTCRRKKIDSSNNSNN